MTAKENLTAALPARAVELFQEGYNCAQAVAGAFAEAGYFMGLSFDQAVRLTEGLGGGLCRLRETCGAVSGGMLVLGACYGHNDPEHPQSKMELYAQGQRTALPFQEKFGTFSCARLLQLPPDEAPCPIPTPRTAEFYQKRPCARFIYEMARLVAEEICRQETDAL